MSDKMRTAIVMSDNREPALTSPSAATLAYPSLAFALNALYACRHGYDLLYYRMLSPECAHQLEGTRHASYCKLPAIAHALERYDTGERAHSRISNAPSSLCALQLPACQPAWTRARAVFCVRVCLSHAVAFIDSDSFFLERNLSLPALIARYAPPKSATPADAAAWFANDLPQLGERPNGGFHVWHGGGGGGGGGGHSVPDAARLLRTWWHLPATKYATEHDYEQHALQWRFGALRDAARRVGVLQLHAMLTPAADSHAQQPLVHIDHTKAERRLWTMSVELIAAAAEACADAVGGGPGGMNSTPERRRRMLALLRQSRGLPAGSEPPPALKQRALRLAAGLLGEGFGTPRGGALHSSGGAACPLQGRTGDASSSTSRLHAYPYNATAMAVRTLPAQGLLSAAGLPLTLERCGETRPGIQQEWLLAADAPQRQLGNVWRLAAAPGFCLAIGPRKAPKSPYPMLAQLMPCDSGRRRGDGSVGNDAAASGLVTLVHDAVASRVRTREPMATLRLALRDAAARYRRSSPHTAGEGGRRLKQKRTASRRREALATKAHATTRRGGGGSGGAAKRKRRKPPLWQDGSVRLPTASDHLCLGTWRSQLSAGVSVVFGACAAHDKAAATAREGAAQRALVVVRQTASSASGVEAGGSRLARLQLGDGNLCVSAHADGVGWPR